MYGTESEIFRVSLIILHIRKVLQMSVLTQLRFLRAPQDFAITSRILLSILIPIHQTNILRQSREQQWLGIHLKEATRLLHCFSRSVITIYGQQALEEQQKGVSFSPMHRLSIGLLSAEG